MYRMLKSCILVDCVAIPAIVVSYIDIYYAWFVAYEFKIGLHSTHMLRREIIISSFFILHSKLYITHQWSRNPVEQIEVFYYFVECLSGTRETALILTGKLANEQWTMISRLAAWCKHVHRFYGSGFLVAFGKWFLFHSFIMMQYAYGCGLSDTYGF